MVYTYAAEEVRMPPHACCRPAAHQPSGPQAARLQSILRESDDEGAGTCSRKDFRRAAQALGQAGSSHEVPALEVLDELYDLILRRVPPPPAPM